MSISHTTTRSTSSSLTLSQFVERPRTVMVSRRFDHLDLTQVLSLVADGDRDAFAVFYDRTANRIFGITKSVLRDPARSEEITQETMLQIWRKAPSFDCHRGSAAGWALSIAHRRAVDCVRSEVARRNRDHSHADTLVLSEPDISDSVIDDLDAGAVRAALSELPNDQRRAIELAYFDGYTHVQIAALLDVPLGTIKWRIRAGLTRLGTTLRQLSTHATIA